MVKFWIYSSVSLLTCAGLLGYTYMTRQQFYPSIIYLVTSKISVLILGNAALVMTMLFGRMVKSFFLGTLRDAEVEILHENVRYAITETCLALTIFREEITLKVVALFTSLVFLKIFHWLSQSRIEFIEQSDVVSRLTHMRLVALMSVLAAVDMTFVVLCGMKVLENGPSVLVLFGFEFLILFITLVSIFLRYILHVLDTRMEGTWTNKFTYLFYLELISEVMKLIIYLIFFLIIFSYYGMPLHIVRDLWMSMKNLQRRIAAYFRYRKIAANLNERFPNPTEEELEETMDRTCIICREEMTSALCKKLPCAHIFHIDCLRMWVQRQQTCPTCRSNIPTTSEQQRPPVVPETPVAIPPPPPQQQQQQAAAQQPAAQTPAPIQAPAAAAHVPGFQVPGTPVRAPAVAPPGTPTPIPASAPATPGSTPATPGGTAGFPHSPYPGGLPGAHHVPPPFAGMPGHPVAPPGMHHPFMPSPFMYPPGMGMGMPPFGMPPFGMMPPSPDHPGHVPGAPHQTHHSYLDPAAIQQQINHLHAQLSALQAYGFPAHPGAPVVPPATGATSATTAPPASVATAIPPAAVSSVPVQQAAQVPAPTSESKPTVAEQQVDEEEEETKENSNTISSPVETMIPPAPMTDVERRREELRRRYNQIYSSTTNDDAETTTTTTTTTEEEDADKSK